MMTRTQMTGDVRTISCNEPPQPPRRGSQSEGVCVKSSLGTLYSTRARPALLGLDASPQSHTEAVTLLAFRLVSGLPCDQEGGRAASFAGSLEAPAGPQHFEPLIRACAHPLMCLTTISQLLTQSNVVAPPSNDGDTPANAALIGTSRTSHTQLTCSGSPPRAITPVPPQLQPAAGFPFCLEL